VVSTPEAASRLATSFPELASRPIAIGPVGWDARDFATPLAPRPDDTFRIVHTGYLHTDLGRTQRRRERLRARLGGARDGVDILTRSHVYLVDAIDALLARRPELHGRLELWLAGVQSAADRDVAVGRGYVHMLGYVAHSTAVDLMRTADLLFLPMHDLGPGHRASIVPGKAYEYIASGRPILAAVPDGDARDILVEAGTADVCDPSEVARMTEILERRVDAFLAGEPSPVPAPGVAERYEYGRLARDLERFFERVVVGARGGSTDA
jgi:glycosyltransferase involved in cell wall biosynthesis